MKTGKHKPGPRIYVLALGQVKLHLCLSFCDSVWTLQCVRCDLESFVYISVTNWLRLKYDVLGVRKIFTFSRFIIRSSGKIQLPCEVFSNLSSGTFIYPSMTYHVGSMALIFMCLHFMVFLYSTPLHSSFIWKSLSLDLNTFYLLFNSLYILIVALYWAGIKYCGWFIKWNKGSIYS